MLQLKRGRAPLHFVPLRLTPSLLRFDEIELLIRVFAVLLG